MGLNFLKHIKTSTSALYLHSVLDKDDWNLEEIKKFLEIDSSSINAVNDKQETPLLSMLQKENCTAEVIQLLLEFGADVNCKDEKGRSALNVALECSMNEDIIKILLGKCVRDNDSSTLCLALRCGASKGVVELLLDAGYLESACVNHGTVLHCAVDSSKSGLKRDVFQLLIGKGADVTAEAVIKRPHINVEPERTSQSVMCYALQNGNEASTLQLLIDAGASLNECRYGDHDCSLLCATKRYRHGLPLQAEVVKLLIESCASVNAQCNNIAKALKCALVRCKYEMEAIRFLLDLVSDIDYGYLETAMLNSQCNPAVVKLLIEHGADIKTQGHCQSVLHLALEYYYRGKSVIKALLENGADVNQVDGNNHSPLEYAISRSADILEEVLAAGAFIHSCNNDYYNNMHYYSRTLLENEEFDCIKVLLKYFFLQHSIFNIESMFEGSVEILKFRDECKHELQKIKSKQIGEDFSLYELIRDYASPRFDSGADELPEKKYDFDQLLKTIVDYEYPLYFNIISDKVGKKSMEKMLVEVKVYTLTYSLDNSRGEKKIVLNYAIMCNIAKFSANDDLLRLILAFYNPKDRPCTGQASNKKNNNNQRRAECYLKCHRNKPRMY